VLCQSTRTGIQLTKSLLHISNDPKLIEILPLQNTKKIGQNFLNALYLGMSKNPELTNKEVQDILVREMKKKCAKMVKLEAKGKKKY
jgi:hypothetical protein